MSEARSPPEQFSITMYSLVVACAQERRGVRRSERTSALPRGAASGLQTRSSRRGLMAAETFEGLPEKRPVFFHGAHREFTARFIGLARVSRGSRLALEAPEAQILLIENNLQRTARMVKRSHFIRLG